jgi:hypothetical protein
MIGLLASPGGLWAQDRAKGPGDVRATRAGGEIKIDGVADEPGWAKAKPFVTYDPQSKVKFTIKALYSADRIYILASFPDADESRTHKTQIWDAAQERYRMALDREDCFVIKWSMTAGPTDLRIDAESPYKADVWFWKAHRTDPEGFADDKMHVYSPLRTPKSKMVISRGGLRFYLSRPGDSGRSAYKTVIHAEKKGERVSLFRFRKPQGSRADVRARGVWRDGRWTIEFARKLATGHPDDVQFDPGQSYLFGVARFEIAGRRVNGKLSQPYFGAGEITQTLRLTFN